MAQTNTDQAQGLRNTMKNQQPLSTPNRRVKVITVTGGKGGVGKSNVSLNLAITMASLGKKVMLLDADLGLANIDVMLGLSVKRNLFNVLRGECTLDDIIIRGPHDLMILPATSGTQSMVELSSAQHAALIRAFGDLKADVDVLIVDTAAGISSMVLSFARAAQDILVVVCDEPTSVTDAYALMKILSRDYGVFRFKIVANMVRTMKEGQDLFAQLTKVAERFLDASLELVGCIPYDPNVKMAIKRQQVIVDAYPKSPAAIAFRALANRAMTWPIPYQAEGHLQFFIENMLSIKEM
ncbi:MAG: MinD/ParA family protein [Succinivibrionaceae bacterium]|nr:MinD/ParA family protein [Succinivibrionaceae bacterium]